VGWADAEGEIRGQDGREATIVVSSDLSSPASASPPLDSAKTWPSLGGYRTLRDLMPPWPCSRDNLPHAVTGAASALLRNTGLVGGLGVLGLAIWLVGVGWDAPFRDDWSYLLTVKSVLVNGHYSLNPWASANPVFQTYWGALFGRTLGLSFESLRLSTLILAAVTVVAMYGLAIEQGLGAWGASIACLGLAGSGAFLILAFSFMTDVPFLALLVLALWLISRALRLNSRTAAIGGSLALGAAMLVRPQGVVVIIALVIMWLSDPTRRNRATPYVTAIGIGSAGAILQLAVAATHPTWFQLASARAESAYLHSSSLGLTVLWRPALAAAYVSAFAIPLGICAAPWMLRNLIAERSNRASLGVGIAVSAVGVIAVRYFASALRAPYAGVNVQATDWLIDSILGDSQVLPGPGILDVCLGSLLIAATVQRYRNFGTLRRTFVSQTLLDHTTVLFVVAIMVIPGILDEYMLPCLPFALVVFARELEHRPLVVKSICVVFVVSLAVVFSSTIRSGLSYSAAEWAAGNFAVSQGIPATRVAASDDWEWYADQNFAAFAAGHAPGKLANGYLGTGIPSPTGLFTWNPSNWIAKIQLFPPREGEKLMGTWSYEKANGAIAKVYLVRR
jgi:hypothetical protein